VVPINYYATEDELDKLFDSLSGFFFVGGGSMFPDSAQYIFDKTVAANDKGDFAPLWGTCMGFQWLLLSAAHGDLKLDPSDGTQMDAENISLPLVFTDKAADSKLLGTAAPTNIQSILQTQNVTMNNHHYGIYPQHFDETPAVMNFYDALSTNKDRQGVAFISTIEAKKYPIFGTQWHPEKNNFEFQEANGIPLEAINHSPDAVLVSQYTANFFVNQARKSTHKFSNPQTEQQSLIYNYESVKTTGSFVETYFFKKDFKSFNE
jgi:gamma-glutamyl hydrolase